METSDASAYPHRLRPPPTKLRIRKHIRPAPNIPYPIFFVVYLKITRLRRGFGAEDREQLARVARRKT